MSEAGGFSIGNKIRVIRQAKRITQEGLASRAGLQKNFISQVEKNVTSLSVGNLLAILHALGEKASVFFDDDSQEKIVFRTEDGIEPEMKNTGHFHILLEADRKRLMDAALLSLNAGEKTEEEEPHEGEEFGYVLSGSIEVALGLRVYSVQKGECFYFKASGKHHFENRQEITVSVLLVSSPPGFDRIVRTADPGENHRRSADAKLSPREKEVLSLVRAGKTTWEISVILSISQRTVKFHVRNILRKVHAVTRAQAVAISDEKGLIDI